MPRFPLLLRSYSLALLDPPISLPVPPTSTTLHLLSCPWSRGPQLLDHLREALLERLHPGEDQSSHHGAIPPFFTRAPRSPRPLPSLKVPLQHPRRKRHLRSKTAWHGARLIVEAYITRGSKIEARAPMSDRAVVLGALAVGGEVGHGVGGEAEHRGAVGSTLEERAGREDGPGFAG